jgi:hypothetical protein
MPSMIPLQAGTAPSVLLKHDGSAAADGEGGGAAAVAPKSFSAKVFLLCVNEILFFLMKIQDTKKKKRAPKAGSLEDWESEGQSPSLGKFFLFLCIYTTANIPLFCTSFRTNHARQTAACWF